MLSADISQMHNLAGTLDDVGKQIDALDVRTAASGLAAALPGCPVSAVCLTAGEYTEGAWLRVADRIRQIATLTTRCADDVEATDADFKTQLDTMAFQLPKGH
ncbi:hypothetical protein [Nocardia sp. CNY236]|uniref:hypothetical protein n=1 Tax=Nocardia sp. CNY236 TaxID=1169152 RepID=UPI0006842D7A|nr:hypothetical protein [Nocardia sp. CNY236]